MEARRIKVRFNMRPDWAKSVETFGAGKLHVAFLQIPRSNVVEAGIPEKKRQRIVGVLQTRTAASNNQGQLAFVLHLLREFCEHDGFFGADDRSRRLEKNQRFFWQLVA